MIKKFLERAYQASINTKDDDPSETASQIQGGVIFSFLFTLLKTAIAAATAKCLLFMTQ